MGTRVFLGGATFGAGHGGIARVARLSARSIVRGGGDLAMAGLLDRGGLAVAGLPCQPAYGSKVYFALLCQKAAMSRGVFVYDSAGIARAHPRVFSSGKQVAVWIHGLEAFEGMRSDYLAAVRRADLVLVNSHYTLARHEQIHGPLPQARVCWLATEQDELPHAPARFDGPPSVLIVGRIDAGEGWKGHDELLTCWPDVVGAIPGARLVIAGSGTGLEALGARVRASAVAANIDVLGFVAEDRMPELFAGAHVFAMPSRQEGFGITYIEAMRYGLPVIASLQDAGQEVNVDGVTGFNVDRHRLDDLRDRLIALLGNTDRAVELGAAGRVRWQEHFRFSRFADRFGAHWSEFTGLGKSAAMAAG
jgi:phosphatidyl-myo-inositol dimannoside synthase